MRNLRSLFLVSLIAITSLAHAAPDYVDQSAKLTLNSDLRFNYPFVTPNEIPLGIDPYMYFSNGNLVSKEELDSDAVYCRVSAKGSRLFKKDSTFSGRKLNYYLLSKTLTILDGQTVPANKSISISPWSNSQGSGIEIQLFRSEQGVRDHEERNVIPELQTCFGAYATFEILDNPKPSYPADEE